MNLTEMEAKVGESEMSTNDSNRIQGARSYQWRSLGCIGNFDAGDCSRYTQLVSTPRMCYRTRLMDEQPAIERDYAHHLQALHRQDRRGMAANIQGMPDPYGLKILS